MSAWMLPHAHIGALADYAGLNGCMPWSVLGEPASREARTAFGRVLLAQNLASVLARYDRPGAVDAPSLRDQAGSFAALDRPVLLPPLVILKACDCYDHQACETDGYERSPAAIAVAEIRAHAIRSLPGWDDASGWPVRPEDIATTRRETAPSHPTQLRLELRPEPYRQPD